MRFTDRGVKALKPKDTRHEVFEDSRKGLGLGISPRGGKSCVFVYRRNGKLSRITVGAYPDTSVADAHAHLGRLRAMLRRGADPAQAARTLKQEETDAPTVTQLAHLYIERYAKVCKRSWHEDERILEKDAIPRWGHLKAKDITRRDVVALLDDIVDRGSPIRGRPGIGAHHALATLNEVIAGKPVSWVLEADLKNFFGSLDHGWLLRFVEHRVGDPRIIRLIRRWLKAGVLDDGELTPNEEGTPQGGSTTPRTQKVTFSLNV